ncbi:MAG: DUF58 domain-containing protein [Salinibacterium sp.]|nr:DUF58 domain-containing protein [Salinibacterium sp.]
MKQPRVHAGFTRRGVVFLVASISSSLAAYATGLRELLYIAILLAVLPIGAILFVWVARPRLAVTRTFAPHIIEAGSSATAFLHVGNRDLRRSIQSRWRDTLPWYPGQTPSADLPALKPRGIRFDGRGNGVDVEYELSPPRRGVFPVGPLVVDVVDAFGLASSALSVGEAQPVVVTPEVFGLPATGLATSTGDGEARLVQRRAVGDDDDTITREYRAGDAMRRVHWRATARHGELMVRQEEQRNRPEARVIVDTRRAGYRDGWDDGTHDGPESESFEWVVRMLASVTTHLRREGFAVSIVETGSSQLAALDRNRQRAWGDEEFLVSLASFGLVDEPLHSSRRPRTSGLTVALLGSPDPATLDWLAGQARVGELAIAFMVQDVSSVDQLNRSLGVYRAPTNRGEPLSEAGWLVVPVRADDDHASAWEAVVFETGRSRAGA